MYSTTLQISEGQDSTGQTYKAQYNKVQHSKVQYNTVEYCRVEYSREKYKVHCTASRLLHESPQFSTGVRREPEPQYRNLAPWQDDSVQVPTNLKDRTTSNIYLSQKIT